MISQTLNAQQGVPDGSDVTGIVLHHGGLNSCEAYRKTGKNISSGRHASSSYEKFLLLF